MIFLIICALIVATVALYRLRPRRQMQTEIGTHYGGWAVVTGASSGIGEKLALFLARQRFQGIVVVATSRSQNALADLRKRILELVPKVAVRIEFANLSRPEEVSAFLERIDTLNVTCLINNAGFGLNGRVDKLDLSRQLEMVSLNCTALLHLSQALVAKHIARAPRVDLPSMIVVNIGSVAGLITGLPWQSVYAASKAFVSSLSRALASEWQNAGVRVLLVEPGTISDTNFQGTSGQPFHKGHLTTDDLVQVIGTNMRYLDYGGSEIIPSLKDRLMSYATQLFPSELIMPLAARRGRKYSPKELV